MSSKIQSFLARHAVFTLRELVAFLDADARRNTRTRESLLAHYIKTGRILRIRRGLYASIPPGTAPVASSIDPYLLAGKMTDDAVLAYHTALEFHGKAYSVHERLLYLTEQAPRPLVFGGRQFRGVLVPTTLREKKRVFFGAAESERAGVTIRMTSLERTLVDVFDRPDLGGGWEEIWRSLESVEYFNLDLVVEYALLLGIATTTAKVGFYLEQHRETLMVEERHLERLQANRPRKPHYLTRGKREAGRLVDAWNLIVPEDILHRSWQEVP